MNISRIFSRSRFKSFCAFCKSPRRLYRKKHVGLTNVVGALVFAAGLTELVWSDADPRGLVIFSLLVFGAEVFVYLRWRAALSCTLCGFDPLLYKTSPARASLRVREFYVRAGDDPRFWLSKSPLVEVHRKQREGERRRREVEGVRARARSNAGPTETGVVASTGHENTRHNSDLQRA